MRNAYIGPGYFTTDLRLSKSFQLSERVRVTLLAESFNVTNRVNQRVDISDDGFLNSAGQFVAYSTKVLTQLYPGEFVKNSKFLSLLGAAGNTFVRPQCRLNGAS